MFSRPLHQCGRMSEKHQVFRGQEFTCMCSNNIPSSRIVSVIQQSRRSLIKPEHAGNILHIARYTGKERFEVKGRISKQYRRV